MEEFEMDNNRRRILEMLADKKISVDEAERLLTAIRTEPESSVGNTEKTEPGKVKSRPKYLRVEVKPGTGDTQGSGETVNIRVPMVLIRAGMKLSSLIPQSIRPQLDSALRERGMEFDWQNIKPEILEEIADNLDDLEIDVAGGRQIVHIYAE